MQGPKRRVRCRITATALALACLATAIACTTQPPTLTAGTDQVPPAAAGGGGLVGVNPEIGGTPGATTTVVPYGPFTVPGAAGPGHGQEGMLNQMLPAVRKPCTSCYLTGVRVTLRYADGRPANIDSGQWLHHAIFISWPHTDATCAGKGLGLLGERFFATGNERTRARFPAGHGYQIGPFDSWTVALDLMNSTPAPTRLVVEATYEWVPATTPGMKAVRPVWLDASSGCVLSGLPVLTGRFSYTTEWVVNRPGTVVGVGAHAHDGGTHLTVTNATTGRLICNAVSGYGGPGYVEPAGGHGHDPAGDPGAGASPPTTDGHGHTDDDHARMHLSSMTQCLAAGADQPVSVLAAGQRVSSVVYYDTGRHALKGSHDLMGVALLYVAP